MNLILGVSIIAAIAAAFACALVHRWARHKHWLYLPRYITGAIIVLVGFSFPVFIAFPTAEALPIIAALGLIFGGCAIGTFLAYDNDPDPPGTPEADELIRRLDEELRK
jgi:hypothetical protein